MAVALYILEVVFLVVMFGLALGQTLRGADREDVPIFLIGSLSVVGVALLAGLWLLGSRYYSSDFNGVFFAAYGLGEIRDERYAPRTAFYRWYSRGLVALGFLLASMAGALALLGV